MRSFVGFPELVNDKAARVVAAGVAVLSATVLLTGAQWLLAIMALGFALRVASGPRFSPLGLVATRLVAPRLGAPVLVAGAPKRFAQGVGLATTVAASVAGLALGYHAVGAGLAAVLLTFATLEAGLGFCAGCWAYGHLIALGVVPETSCVACADISLRRKVVAG
ncbi:MAG: DUF4395 domain-containing protein [Nostocoides sp.]